MGPPIIKQQTIEAFMAETIAVSSQKGGVAKTTTAVNLAASLCQYGKKVLLVDLDPQGHCARATGTDPTTLKKTIKDLLLGKYETQKVISHTRFKNLDLLPSNYILGGIEVELKKSGTTPSYEDLKKKLAPIEDSYDFIIIDCPPSLSYLTFNALTAATSILLPVQCEYFAMEDLSLTLSAIANVQHSTNPNLEILGVLITMYDKRSRLCHEIAGEIYDTFKEKAFATPIPRSIVLAECQAMGTPVNISKPNSQGAKAYLALARDVLAYEKKKDQGK